MAELANSAHRNNESGALTLEFFSNPMDFYYYPILFKLTTTMFDNPFKFLTSLLDIIETNDSLYSPAWTQLLWTVQFSSSSFSPYSLFIHYTMINRLPLSLCFAVTNKRMRRDKISSTNGTFVEKWRLCRGHLRMSCWPAVGVQQQWWWLLFNYLQPE